MYFGLPIVCYELTEHKVSAQDAALYVEANSEWALADGIGALLDDPARRARMARYGAERVRAELAWQHSVPPLLAAYEAVFASARAVSRTTGWSSKRAATWNSDGQGD